jgi:LMBR1-like membrane protein
MTGVVTTSAVTVPLVTRAWWNYLVYVRPWLYRGAAVAAAALSALILWGEVMVGFSASLSPLSYIMTVTRDQFFEQVRLPRAALLTDLSHRAPLCFVESQSSRCQAHLGRTWHAAAKIIEVMLAPQTKRHGAIARCAVQLLVMLPLMYVIAATYSAIFAVDLGSLYILLPHSSSSFSLLFNGNLMARFAPSLCYNYLHVLSMDRPTKEGFLTVFAQRMGMGAHDSDVAIPFLGTPFNRWAPVIMIAVVALTFFNAFGAP